jgi:predicted O-methyltransferase YrrM
MYILNEDWFSHNIPIFNDNLAYFKNKPVNFLEIGSYEGRSAIWMLENILTNENSHLTCVDPGYSGGSTNLRNNLATFKNITIIEEPIEQYCKFLLLFGIQYDFIYVDGDHKSDSVYFDSIIAYELLKQGGILAWDDYLWKDDKDNESVKFGIDKFLNRKKMKVIHNGYQKWCVKI